ncbi:MAG: GNAT family N-acetyltransferase [Spirochaetota bacterium]
MKVKNRLYKRNDDFNLICKFLCENYKHNNKDGNWFQATWEYMYCHPNSNENLLDKICIWENSDEIVGIVNHEGELGEAFFQIHPDYNHLKTEMLEYAENALFGKTNKGDKYLRVYINDFDKEFEQIVRSSGYTIDDKYNRPMSQYIIPEQFPEIRLPEGFKLKSLQEDNDLNKVNRILWRGFNHSGEPPTEDLEGRRKMQSAPNFRKDLNIVVENPPGNFISYCGMWYDNTNKIAYVEPVATDPDYRRRGFGKIAVLEGIKRCAEFGATVAYVGSEQKFYQTLGFEKIYTSRCWLKYL